MDRSAFIGVIHNDICSTKTINYILRCVNDRLARNEYGNIIIIIVQRITDEQFFHDDYEICIRLLRVSCLIDVNSSPEPPLALV